MGGAEQVGASSCRSRRETGAASSQEVGGCSAGMSPVVVADGWESQRADGFTESLPSPSESLVQPDPRGDGAGGGGARRVAAPPELQRGVADDDGVPGPLASGIAGPPEAAGGSDAQGDREPPRRGPFRARRAPRQQAAAEAATVSHGAPQT